MEAAQGPGNDLQVTFTQLVEAYQKPLLNLCHMILRDRTQAEDAVQEAFLKAYRALPGFRQDCSWKTWLTRIAVNVWNVICQGQIYPILKFLSHNTHIFIKIAKETVMRCLFCHMGYEQRKARNETGKSASLRANCLSFGCIFMMLRDRMYFLFGTLE